MLEKFYAKKKASVATMKAERKGWKTGECVRERDEEGRGRERVREPGRDKLMLQVTQLVACSINYADMRHQKADKEGGEQRVREQREGAEIVRGGREIVIVRKQDRAC